MKEFVLIFRMDITTPGAQPSPEQMEGYMQQWHEWTGSISASNRLAPGGNHLSPQGRVVRPGNVITQGPYTEKRKSVAGYLLVRAENLDEALLMAMECPILKGEGTSVEVREIPW